ncbi:MAG: hypothetical protein HY575_00355, partial [candidate division NC10 bacterium]|nr:hypothetical protein [candidate division NC10 bacterium]
MGAGTPIREPAAGTVAVGAWEAVRRIAKDRRTVVGVGIALGAALVLGAGLLAFRLYEGRQELKAQALLGEALTRAEGLADVLRGGKPQ